MLDGAPKADIAVSRVDRSLEFGYGYTEMVNTLAVTFEYNRA